MAAVSLAKRRVIRRLFNLFVPHELCDPESMVKVESFSSLTKQQEDLMRLGYCYKSLATVTVETSDNEAVFKARAAQKAEGTVLSSSSIKLTKGAVVVTPKRRTDGLGVYTVEYAANQEVKVKAEGRVVDAPEGTTREVTTSVEVKKTDYVVKAAFINPNTAVRLSGTYLKGNTGFGFDGKFTLEKKRFESYNFAAWYAQDDQTIVLKHNGCDKDKYAPGELALSYYRNVSSSTHLAALAKYSIPTKTPTLDLAGDYQVDKTMTIRGKLSSSGLLGLALSKKLVDCISVTVAAQFDTKKFKTNSLTDYKFGFKLGFNTANK